MLTTEEYNKLGCVIYNLNKQLLNSKLYGISCDKTLINNYNIAKSYFWLNSVCCSSIKTPYQNIKSFINSYNYEENIKTCFECDISITEIQDVVSCPTINIIEL